MRLSEAKIDSLAVQLMAVLEASDSVTLKANPSQVLFRIKSVITEDLRREDELDEEVRSLLEMHLRGKNRMSIDYQSLFKKAKAQMVRERKLVL